MQIFFAYLLQQLPEMQGLELASFDPFELLAVEEDATDQEIKKAFRKLSALYHPDKNPNNSTAAKMFMDISKAKDTLLDADMRATWEKYGSAEGLKGALQVAIGLPTFLLQPENHVPVLVLYFFLFLFLPPTAVWIWWRQARDYHESGIRNETVVTFGKFITENMHPKFLLEVLAASAEFRPLAESGNKTLYDKLVKSVKEFMVKQRFNKVYIVRSNSLLHAHLLRKEIPAELQAHLESVLSKVHKLLMTAVDILFTPNHEKRRWLRPGFACMELQQMVTQAMWGSDSPYMQIKHMDGVQVIAACARKWRNFNEFRMDSAENRRKVLEKVLTPEQVKEAEANLAMLPNLVVTYKAEVDGEEGMYEGDIVKVTINLKRVAKVEVEEEDEDDIPDLMDMDEDGKVAGEGEAKDENKDKEDDVDADEAERRLVEELPTVPKKPRKAKTLAPVVCAPRFPWVKREGWLVALVMRPPKGSPAGPHAGVVIGHKKVLDLDEEDKFEFFLRAPGAGSHPYEVIVMSDSYRDCDYNVPFQMHISKAPTITETSKGGDVDADEVDPLDEEEPVFDPKWYYLWHESLGELILTLIVLYMGGLFAQNWLQTRGYWDAYFIPVFDKVYTVVGPTYETFLEAAAPVLTPLMGGIAKFTEALTRKPQEVGDDL